MTQRKDKSKRGSSRGRSAETSRMEALAVELARRAFASPSGSMWDDVPARQPGRHGGIKQADYDRGVLQRQNVESSWPHPQDGYTRDEWGDSQSRRIRQYHGDHSEARRLAEAGSRPPMMSSRMSLGRDYDPLEPYSDQPHYAQRPNYNQYHKEGKRDMETQEGLYEALGRLFGR